MPQGNSIDRQTTWWYSNKLGTDSVSCLCMYLLPLFHNRTILSAVGMKCSIIINISKKRKCHAILLMTLNLKMHLIFSCSTDLLGRSMDVERDSCPHEWLMMMIIICGCANPLKTRLSPERVKSIFHKSNSPRKSINCQSIILLPLICQDLQK